MFSADQILESASKQIGGREAAVLRCRALSLMTFRRYVQPGFSWPNLASLWLSVLTIARVR